MKKNVLLMVVVAFLSVPAFAVTIHVEAEDCILSGLAYTGSAYGAEGLTTVEVASKSEYDWDYSASGEGRLLIPVSIPDGTYTLTMSYRQAYWNSPSVSYAWKLGTNSGTVVENGTDIGGEWHTFWVNTNQYSNDTPFTYVTDELAGPVSGAWDPATSVGYLSGSGWGAVKPATSITLSGVGAGGFYVDIWDMNSFYRTCLVIDSFDLTLIPEPATMSLLALGGLGLIRRK
jgi:hypothetical protein